MPKEDFWTAYEQNLLISQWGIKSALQIGLELGRTRNAICGKAMRLRRDGLLGKDGKTYAEDPWHRKDRTRKKRGIRKVRKLIPPRDPPPPPPDKLRNVLLVDVEYYHCRWPIGDPKDTERFMFCGARKVDGLPYCQDHARLAYHNPPSIFIRGKDSEQHQDAQRLRNSAYGGSK